MILDLLTVSVITALVVVVSGVIFMIETLLREDDSVSRIWSLGFLSGIVASVSYVVWSLDPEIWWAVAIGNAAFVACSGLMWLGSRFFNGRSIRGAIVIATLFTSAAGLAVFIEGESGGGWAGAGVMFVGLTALPAAAAIESARGELRRLRIAAGLVVVFALESAYYGARTVVLVTFGTDSEVFQTWWGTVPTSMLTVVLTIVAVVIASVLRAERVGIRGRETGRMPGAADGVLDHRSFRNLLSDAVARSRRSGDSVAVTEIRIGDLSEVAMAFGAVEANSIRSAARAAVRVGVPTQAWIGADGADAFVVATVVDSPEGARRAAYVLLKEVRTALRNAAASVAPALGAGVAVDDAGSQDAGALIESARVAAIESAENEDDEVVVATSVTP